METGRMRRMKRFGAASIAFLALLALAATIEGARKSMSVQVRQGQVRATPSFLGKVVATLSYGDRVEALEDKDGWVRIAPPGNKSQGWIHSSALTEKRIVLKAGKKEEEIAASGGELALAGKGFNADVEAEFKARNKDVDFTWVDKMQAMKVPPERIRAFLQEGDLASGKGGAQ
jgi:SH3-like domain-containing protein